MRTWILFRRSCWDSCELPLSMSCDESHSNKVYSTSNCAESSFIENNNTLFYKFLYFHYFTVEIKTTWAANTPSTSNQQTGILFRSRVRKSINLLLRRALPLTAAKPTSLVIHATFLKDMHFLRLQLLTPTIVTKRTSQRIRSLQ